MGGLSAHLRARRDAPHPTPRSLALTRSHPPPPLASLGGEGSGGAPRGDRIRRHGFLSLHFGLPQRRFHPSSRVSGGEGRPERSGGRGGGSLRAPCSPRCPPPNSALACAHAEPPSPPRASRAGGGIGRRAARRSDSASRMFKSPLRLAAAAVASLLPRERWGGSAVAKRRPGWGVSPLTVLAETPPTPASALAAARAEPPSPPLASLAGGGIAWRAARGSGCWRHGCLSLHFGLPQRRSHPSSRVSGGEGRP